MIPARHVEYAVIALVGLLSASMLTIYLVNFGSTDDAVEMPRSFGGFELKSTIDGREAIESVRRLHVGSVEEIRDATIAMYMNPSGRRIHLWVADFVDGRDAETSMERMVSAMKRSPQYGYTPKDYSLNGVKVYVSLGEDKVDVFWVHGNRLLYLLISQSTLEESLSITREFMSRYKAQS